MDIHVPYNSELTYEKLYNLFKGVTYLIPFANTTFILFWRDDLTVSTQV
jgi:hypothetical protein